MIPEQKDVNWYDPSQHFAWALRSLPTPFGSGAVTHPDFLTQWSEHLWQCGFAHRDYLVQLADENGMIHVDQLPQQSIKWQPPIRGQYSYYNNASRWVPVNEPDPPKVILPDIRELTADENAAMIAQYREAGMLDGHTSSGQMASEE
jgi:hypothetical protein